MKPLISVLMLTYNQGDYIERSVKSVLEQKSESYDLEILITDDGSSDNTVNIIRHIQGYSSVPIRLNEKSHEGVSSIASNFLSLVDDSQGDYIAFLAGDDFYLPDRFLTHLKMFSANVDLKIVYSEGINYENGESKGRCHPPNAVAVMESEDVSSVYHYLTTESPVLFIQGVLARGGFLRSIKPFDVDLIADDWVFNLKVFSSMLNDGGGYFFDSSPRFIRNIHGSNTSRNLRVHYERVSQVADRYCQKSWIIRSRYIGNALVKAIRSRSLDDAIFFAKEMTFAPLSVYWVLKFVVKALLKGLKA